MDQSLLSAHIFACDEEIKLYYRGSRVLSDAFQLELLGFINNRQRLIVNACELFLSTSSSPRSCILLKRKHDRTAGLPGERFCMSEEIM